jgi:GMP synthase (glutamine-hydrolysing)
MNIAPAGGCSQDAFDRIGELRLIRIVASARRPSLGILRDLLRQTRMELSVHHYRSLGHLDPRDLIIILGGTMSVCDPIERSMLPFMRALENHIARGGRSIGLCLGAQIQARVLGGNVRPHPDGIREIGYHEMLASERHGGGDLPAGAYYCWHYDHIEPTHEMVVTLHNAHSAVQAFRYRKQVHGFQFHPEIDLRAIKRFTQFGAARLTEPGVQAAATQRALHSKIQARNRRSFAKFLRQCLKERGDNS